MVARRVLAADLMLLLQGPVIAATGVDIEAGAAADLGTRSQRAILLLLANDLKVLLSFVMVVWMALDGLLFF